MPEKMTQSAKAAFNLRQLRKHYPDHKVGALVYDIDTGSIGRIDGEPYASKKGCYVPVHIIVQHDRHAGTKVETFHRLIRVLPEMPADTSEGWHRRRMEEKIRAFYAACEAEGLQLTLSAVENLGWGCSYALDRLMEDMGADLEGGIFTLP